MTSPGQLTRRLLLGTAGPALLAAGTAAASEDELIVSMYGGPVEQLWRRYVVDPFSREVNKPVIIATGLPFDNLAKMRASRGNPQIDVVAMDPMAAVPAAMEGLWDPLDPTKVTVLNDLYDWAIEKDRNYVSWLRVYYGLAYNTDKIKAPPTSWDDLLNPAYKGHVIFPDISGTGATTMLDIFAQITGGDISTNNADTAFKKIIALRPQLLTFWTSHDQVGQLLSQGEAWITPWPSSRALTLRSQGAPVDIAMPREGVPFQTSEIGIAKGTRQKDLAEKYLNYALGAGAQKHIAETAFLGPTNKKVQLPPELAARMYPAPGGKILTNADWTAAAKYRSEWIDRWNREVR